MAKNFGKPDYEYQDATQARQTTTANVSASGMLRDWSVILFVLGCFCLIPPATPIGIVMMIFGGALWVLCPVAKVNEQAMIAETERTGNGCGAFLVALIMGVVVIVIAGVIAAGGIELMVAGGMVAR